MLSLMGACFQGVNGAMVERVLEPHWFFGAEKRAKNRLFVIINAGDLLGHLFAKVFHVETAFDRRPFLHKCVLEHVRCVRLRDFRRCAKKLIRPRKKAKNNKPGNV